MESVCITQIRLKYAAASGVKCIHQRHPFLDRRAMA